MRDLERRGGQRHWHKEGAGRPTWPIKMPIKIMPHLAGGASNEPIFGEVGLNFWNKRRHEDNLKAHRGTFSCVEEKNGGWSYQYKRGGVSKDLCNK